MKGVVLDCGKALVPRLERRLLLWLLWLTLPPEVLPFSWTKRDRIEGATVAGARRGAPGATGVGEKDVVEVEVVEPGVCFVIVTEGVNVKLAPMNGFPFDCAITVDTIQRKGGLVQWSERWMDR